MHIVEERHRFSTIHLVAPCVRHRHQTSQFHPHRRVAADQPVEGLHRNAKQARPHQEQARRHIRETLLIRLEPHPRRIRRAPDGR